MSAVTIHGAGAITMTSLELVEFINSQRGPGEAELRHADFLAKVVKVLGSDERKFSSVYKGGNGQDRPCYRFPKREACLMAMSYSYELQAKVFDRMTELEAQAAQPTSLALPDFTNPAAAARAWAAEFERRQALELETSQQAKVLAVTVPKAAVFDDLHHRPGCMCIRDAAKNIGVGERALIRKLIEVGWLYRRDLADGRQGSLKASAYTLERGYFEHQPRTGRDGAVRDSLLVTVKGLHKLTYKAFQVWGLRNT